MKSRGFSYCGAINVAETWLPKESDYTVAFTEEIRVRLRYRVSGNDVGAFTVQLEMILNGEWCPIARYDGAHGVPHLDILDRHGRLLSKTWLAGSFNDVLTIGIEDFCVRATGNRLEH